LFRSICRSMVPLNRIRASCTSSPLSLKEFLRSRAYFSSTVMSNSWQKRAANEFTVLISRMKRIAYSPPLMLDARSIVVFFRESRSFFSPSSVTSMISSTGVAFPSRRPDSVAIPVTLTFSRECPCRTVPIAVFEICITSIITPSG